MSLFSSPPPKKDPWPTLLNPCPHNGEHLTFEKWGRRKHLWWCNGYVTKLCSNCVWEKQYELQAQGMKNPRREALKTFTPDLTGHPCE